MTTLEQHLLDEARRVELQGNERRFFAALSRPIAQPTTCEEPAPTVAQQQKNYPVLTLNPAKTAADLKAILDRQQLTADGVMQDIMREVDDTYAEDAQHDDTLRNLPEVDPNYLTCLAMYPNFRAHLLFTNVRALIAADTLKMQFEASAAELPAPQLDGYLGMMQRAADWRDRAAKWNSAIDAHAAAKKAVQAGPAPCLMDVYERMHGPLVGAAS